MGDVISGVFGGAQQTTQDVSLDPTTRALNELRRQQAQGAFNTAPLWSFLGGANAGAAYTPSPEVARLYGEASQPGREADLSNMLSLPDYVGAYGTGSAAARDVGLGQAGYALGRQQQDIAAALNEATARNANIYGNQLARADLDYAAMKAAGLDQASNYIREIALPQIQAQSVLQGQERSGATDAAIAKATAEIGLPYMQQLAQAYMGGRTGLGQSYMSDIGQLGQQYLSQQAAAGQQYGATTGNLAGQYLTGAQGFWQGLPQASSTLTMTPEQARLVAGQASLLPVQRATSLMPLADYSRGLQEQNLMRQQGLLSTAYTGLPYTPATSTRQVQQQPSLLSNVTGVGSPTGFFGAGTGFF